MIAQNAYESSSQPNIFWQGLLCYYVVHLPSRTAYQIFEKSAIGNVYLIAGADSIDDGAIAALPKCFHSPGIDSPPPHCCGSNFAQPTAEPNTENSSKRNSATSFKWFAVPSVGRGERVTRGLSVVAGRRAALPIHQVRKLFPVFLFHPLDMAFASRWLCNEFRWPFWDGSTM